MTEDHPRPQEITMMRKPVEPVGYSSDRMTHVMDHCNDLTLKIGWIVPELMVLVLGLAANLLLAWLFMRERKDLSPSKVLGVNLVMIQLLYLMMSFPGLAVYWSIEPQGNSTGKKDSANSTSEDWMEPHWIMTVKDLMSVLNLVGSPLLLACMCIERYTAVARPMLYLRARKWKYKIAISAAVWAITLIFLVTVALAGLPSVIILIAVIICCLFLVMLSCLVGVAWSLCQQSPAHSTSQPLASSPPPLKRRALWNVLAVMLPAVCSYLPVVFFIPVVTHMEANETWCTLLEVILFFPICGVFIGPTFYLAKARQILCVRKGGQRPPG